MRADDTLPLGTNEVLLSMNGWAEARVRDGSANLEVKPAPKKKLEPITARLRKTIPLGKNKYFIGLGFQDDGKNLIGYTDQGGALMDVEGGRLEVRIPWRSEPTVLRTRLSADKRLFFVGRVGWRTEQVVTDGKTKTIYHPKGRIDAYEVATGRRLPFLEGRAPTSVYELAISPDGKWLATEEAGTSTLGTPAYSTVLLDLKSNKSILLNTPSSPGSLSFTSDTKQLVGNVFGVKGAKSQLLVWNLPDPKPTVLATDADAIFWDPWFTSDGKWMLFRRRPKDEKQPLELELRRCSDDKPVWKGTQAAAEKSPYALIDSKNRFLALLESGVGCRMRDLATLTQITAFELHGKASFWSPQFSPDGIKFAVLSQDVSISNPRSTDLDSFEQPVLWLVDMTRPTLPERVVLPPNRSWRFWWTPDGNSIVVEGLARHLVLDATNIAQSIR